AKPGHASPVPAVSPVVALMAVAAVAVGVVMQVTVVSIDRPSTRWVSRKSLWRFLDPSGGAEIWVTRRRGTASVASCLPAMESGESESITHAGPEQATCPL